MPYTSVPKSPRSPISRTPHDSRKTSRTPRASSEAPSTPSKSTRATFTRAFPSCGKNAAGSRSTRQRRSTSSSRRKTKTFRLCTIRRVTVSSPSTMTLSLLNKQGREVVREGDRDHVAGTVRFRTVRSAEYRARAMSIAFTTKGGGGPVILDDVRLEGQSAALREHVLRNLQFPAR